jgi:putative transposase
MEPGNGTLSLLDQCRLPELARSRWYYDVAEASAEDPAMMRRIDNLHLKLPIYGNRKIAIELGVNRHRVQRLMRRMGIEATYPRPQTSRSTQGHAIYPFLLRNLEVSRPDQVWCSDITYIPMKQGFLYLVTVMDWYSRYVLSWRLSNTMDVSFCPEALDESLNGRRPRISIPTRDRSSPPWPSPADLRKVESGSPWTVADGHWITSSSSDSGGR